MDNTFFTMKQPIVSTLSFSHWKRMVFLPFLATRVVLLLVGYAAFAFLAPRFSGMAFLPQHSGVLQESWQMWRWFDSFWYLNIVEHGYASASALHSPTNWVFYPLYPFCLYIGGRLLGGSDTAFTIAGILLSNGAACIALTYLYLLVERDFGGRIAKRTVVYLIVFPLAFYLSAVYTESLWLALAIACLYYARRRRWGMAGFLGALAALTRPQGVGLCIPLLWEYWHVVSEREQPLLFQVGWARMKAWCSSHTKGTFLAARRWSNWQGLLCVCCVPFGILAFLGYAWFKTGDLLATFHTEQWGWGRHTVAPWATVEHALVHPQPFSITDWSAWPINMAMIALFLLLLLLMIRRLPSVYVVYAAVMIVFPLCTGRINSIDRYYLTIFPVQILLAKWSLTERRGIIHWSFFTVCLVGECLGMACFVLGFPFIA